MNENDPEANEGLGETRRSADQPVPNTRAPEAGSPPVAGKVSPAEKSEPAGVPIEEQRHNADPNAPQTQVSPPGSTQTPETETGGVPLSSLDSAPDLGTDEARERAQIRHSPSTPTAGEGTSRQTNNPNVLPRESDLSDDGEK